MIDCRPCHILLVFELQLYFVSLVMLCLFDCRAEGITTLFVFGHVSSRLAMIKSGGSRFQFCADAAINPQFQGREGFYSHSGDNISDALDNKLTESAYTSMLLSEAIRNISQAT